MSHNQAATYDLESQSIGLVGVPNARELGGYIMPDGHKVKHGLLLRGADLSTPTEYDVKRLQSFNLKKIFDFRTQDEAAFRPDATIPGAQYFWLPTLDPVSGEETKSMWDTVRKVGLREFMVANASNKDLQAYAATMYTSMVVNEYTQVQYAGFFQQILQVKGGAIYWHCSQGKDRTGLGAAFILAALGADRETILADYRISNEAYYPITAPLYKRVKENGGGEDELTVVRTFIGVHEPYFVAGLDLIDKEYGSMDNYLRDILLLSDSDIEELRQRYLE